MPPSSPLSPQFSLTSDAQPGGKAKPLKAAKKAVKDLDDDDLAYQEKKRAGTLPPRNPKTP